MQVPFCNITDKYLEMRDQILQVTDTVYKSGDVVDGDRTYDLERTLAAKHNRTFGIALGSGTDALTFALKGLHINNYDIDYDNTHKTKVLVPNISFKANATSVLAAGLEPVFCEVDRLTGLIDLDRIPVPLDELAAIVVVNLFGNMVDYDKLTTLRTVFASSHVPVIEDAAQSFGARYKGQVSGSFGEASCFSFDPSKPLHSYSTGGMILTDDINLYNAAMAYRNNDTTAHKIIGGNSKISEADAAQLLVKLKYVYRWQAERQAVAELYNEELKDCVVIPPVSDDVLHSYSRYVIHYNYRQDLSLKLDECGVATKIHYKHPLSYEAQSVLTRSGLTNEHCAKGFTRTCLSLPIDITMKQARYVVQCIQEIATMSAIDRSDIIKNNIL